MRFITKKQLAKFKEKLKKHKKLLIGAGIGVAATIGTVVGVQAFRNAKKVNQRVKHIDDIVKSIKGVQQGVKTVGKHVGKKQHEADVFTVENVKKGVKEKEAKEKRKGSLILPGAFPS
jgi:hypothetical protein